MEEQNPLVSIIVITYNSAKFVLETLESARAQTYENIELIVSDDCSTDNTVEICRQWIEENKERFVRSELITSPENTGIPANCNRGVKAAQGEWVKFIAGDDILMDNCITDFIAYIHLCVDNIRILVGASIVFEGNLSLKSLTRISYNDLLLNSNLTAETQFQKLLRDRNISAPGAIIQRKLLIELNGFDEDYFFIEDLPLWLKATKKGNKIYGMAKPVVYYRIHNSSVFGFTNMVNKKIVHDIYWKFLKFRKEKIYPELDIWGKLVFIQTNIRNKLLILSGNNRKSLLCKLILLFFNFFSLKKLDKIINKKFYK